MSRKDYELIARTMRETRADIEANWAYDREAMIARLSGATVAAQRLSFALAATNPRFDSARFLAACGAA